MGAKAPLDPPYIVSKGKRTYYVAADGSAWRVRDTLSEPRREREVKLGSPDATVRLFTNPDGRRQAYHFAGDESRVVCERELDRQLRASTPESRNESPDPEAPTLGSSALR